MEDKGNNSEQVPFSSRKEKRRRYVSKYPALEPTSAMLNAAKTCKSNASASESSN